MRAFVLVVLVAPLLLGGVIGEASAQRFPPAPDSAASGYFRAEDTLPGSYRLYQQQPKELNWLWAVGPKKPELRRASFAADAHAETPNYSPRTRCIECHAGYAKDMHQTRAGITCVQCHRDTPIAGIYHYFSAMNPIRRHAYICAKCHEGASPSFASYVVHEPNVLTASALGEFPLLFYATWFMIIVAGSVFVVFIPYSAFWGIRELIDKLSKKAGHG